MTTKAHIFDIKRDCSEDGPGIRTTVFFKGCPLSCIWCQNPEGKTKEIRLSFDEQLCHPEKCNVACVAVCEAHCLSFVDKLHVSHDDCTRCGKCFDVCPTNALQAVGYWLDLDELLYRVLIDEPFYRSSNGGVTLSGGEASYQMAFAGQFLQALKKHNINTALETSGFFNYPKFQKQMLPYLDTIYFDLKLIDDEESRKYTGQSSKLIFDNFSKLIHEPHVSVIPRIPLIPEITTTEHNLKAIANFLRSNKISDVELMPYNPLWTDKIKKIGLNPIYVKSGFMTEIEKQQSIRFFEITPS